MVILCDVNDNEDEQMASNLAQSSSQNNKILSDFKTLSRAVSVYGMCKEIN